MIWNRTTAVFAALLAAGITAPAQEPAKPLSKSEIESIVKEYILQHPEVLLESVRLHQERERASRQQRAKDALSAKQPDIHNDPSSPVTKPASAKQVSIVEFFDYRCGYCKRVYPTLMKVLADNPDVRLVYKEFPILGPDSLVAAKAALAVAKQSSDKYQKFHDVLMRAQTPPTAATIEKTAQDLGVDVAKMKKDMESPEIEAIIARNRELAQSLNVEATPTFVIGGELVPGAMDENTFKQLITKAKEQADSPAAASKPSAAR